MHPTTCPACGHEYEVPAFDQSGPSCPRCGDPVAGPAALRTPGLVVPVEAYVSAAIGGAALGLLAAAVLLLSRW